MNKNWDHARKYLFIGITIIALSIVFSTTLKEISSTLGTVMIAVGGLFFIIGMSKKRQQDEQDEK